MIVKTSSWTMSQVEGHLKVNLNNQHCYGAAIVCAALFHKLYGHFPKIGLSGYQAEAASFLVDVLPHPEDNAKEVELEFPIERGK